jgi:hypothetical protein
MDIAEMSMRVYYCFKGSGDRRIPAKVAVIYGRDTYNAESVKDSAANDESNETDSMYFCRARGPPSDIAKEISKLLNKENSISSPHIADSPRESCRLVKRILSKIFTMKKFSL